MVHEIAPLRDVPGGALHVVEHYREKLLELALTAASLPVTVPSADTLLDPMKERSHRSTSFQVDDNSSYHKNGSLSGQGSEKIEKSS